WRDHWPRETAMMRAAVGSARATVHPSALADVAPVLQRMVIIGEDSRFRSHHGIDPEEIADALGRDRTTGVWPTVAALWRRRHELRGASTITQQLAKNLYLSASRSPLRKVKEAVTALRLELALPKDRILELYLAVVEWGPGVWGAEAASQVYFGVPASRLDEVQAATLAATLPQPLSANPGLRPERLVARRDLIWARYHGVAVAIPPEEEVDSVAGRPERSPSVDSSAGGRPPLDTAPPESLRARPDSR
ncbi:MAG TPA: biosynthetic peptidoglycan transglycosylase, partial [Gemmatimonadales bacterium]|nr:biosynthetic peptidoglycan transglycosylase [Gemmatimonadales bacterium]